MAKHKGSAGHCSICSLKNMATGFFTLVAANSITMYLAGGAVAISLLWVVVSILIYFGLYNYSLKARTYQ